MENLTGSDLVKAVIAFDKGELVKIDGQSFINRANSWSFNQAIKNLPKKHGIDKITVDLIGHQDFIGNADLDPLIHKGFTIGRGKVMYFMFTLTNIGCYTIYPVDMHINSRRHITAIKANKTTITIHFHNNKSLTNK